MAYRKAWAAPQVGLGEARTIRSCGGAFAILATDLVTANTVGLFVVPAGFVVTDIAAYSTDMDTGTNAMTLSLGDATLATRLLNASTIGQAGTSVLVLASTGQNYKFLVDTEILLTVTLGPTVAAAGTLTINLKGWIE